MELLFEAHAPALILTLAVVVVGLLLYLFVYSLAWGYRDAEARGRSGWTVALLLFLCKWPISLLFWVALRPPLASEKMKGMDEPRPHPFG